MLKTCFRLNIQQVITQEDSRSRTAVIICLTYQRRLPGAHLNDHNANRTDVCQVVNHSSSVHGCLQDGPQHAGTRASRVLRKEHACLIGDDSKKEGNGENCKEMNKISVERHFLQWPKKAAAKTQINFCTLSSMYQPR
jgi:hypothetical protein